MLIKKQKTLPEAFPNSFGQQQVGSTPHPMNRAWGSMLLVTFTLLS